ncbi:transketolase C-terminal domain-containing protein [Nocardiopsis dassonvillei]|uniref:transketolase C-terminal domain-containing protein n=1 Tax=Nocardiopsis dassonvillei TaxID=2014 RepID=UPI003F54C261
MTRPVRKTVPSSWTGSWTPRERSSPRGGWPSPASPPRSGPTAHEHRDPGTARPGRLPRPGARLPAQPLVRGGGVPGLAPNAGAWNARSPICTSSTDLVETHPKEKAPATPSQLRASASGLRPLDDESIARVVAATSGRAVVAHEAAVSAGPGAEVAARISETHFGRLAAPVVRIGTPEVRMPSAPVLREALPPPAAASSTPRASPSDADMGFLVRT